MNAEEFRNYCLSLPYVTEKMPFLSVKDSYSSEVLCFYIGSKWFCYVNIQVFDRCCVKMNPQDAILMRQQYEGIQPAWHMNKKHWSDVYFRSDVTSSMIKDLIKQSYDLVKSSLPKKERELLVTGN